MRVPKILLACAAAGLLVSGCATPVAGTAAPDPEGVDVAEQAADGAGGAPSGPSTAQEPTAEESTAEEPTAEEPTAEEPTTEEPTTEDEPADPEGPLEVSDFAAQLYAANLTVTSARGSMEMDMAGVTVDATYDMTMADGVGESISMTMEMALPDVVEMKLLMVDGQFYLGGDSYLDLLGLDVPSGKWILLDPAAQDRTIATMAREMESSMRMQGPSQIAAMVDVAESVEFVGQEELDGEPRDHYRLELDGEKALELGAGASGAGELPPGVEIGTIPMDLWLDEQGRTSRMSMSIDIAGESVDMTIDLFDFDEPVVIEAPQPDELADLPD